MKYLVVIKRAGTNYFASSPDVPLCFATGDTVAEARENFSRALKAHLDGLRESGGVIPTGEAVGEYVTVD